MTNWNTIDPTVNTTVLTTALSNTGSCSTASVVAGDRRTARRRCRTSSRCSSGSPSPGCSPADSRRTPARRPVPGAKNPMAASRCLRRRALVRVLPRTVPAAVAVAAVTSRTRPAAGPGPGRTRDSALRSARPGSRWPAPSTPSGTSSPRSAVRDRAVPTSATKDAHRRALLGERGRGALPGRHVVVAGVPTEHVLLRQDAGQHLGRRLLRSVSPVAGITPTSPPSATTGVPPAFGAGSGTTP